MKLISKEQFKNETSNTEIIVYKSNTVVNIILLSLLMLILYLSISIHNYNVYDMYLDKYINMDSAMYDYSEV